MPLHARRARRAACLRASVNAMRGGEGDGGEELGRAGRERSGGERPTDRFSLQSGGTSLPPPNENDACTDPSSLLILVEKNKPWARRVGEACRVAVPQSPSNVHVASSFR